MKKALLFFLGLIVLLFFVLYSPPIPLEKLKSSYTDEYSEFVEWKGLEVHYRVEGSGFPLLLIHGTSSSLQTWNEWTKVLSPEFKVYSVDLPGCGLTGPLPTGDYTMAMYLDFLEDFTADIGLDSFYMAGNSLGGHIVWEYARVSSKVKKAVLVDPSGFYEEDRSPPLVFQLGEKKVFASIVEVLNVRPLIKKSLKDVFYDDSKITPDLLERYVDLLRRKGNRKAFIEKAAIKERSPVEELQDVNCPVLLQWGKEDLWIPLSLSEIFLENLPDVEMITYDECGHVPQEELPILSATDAMKFLNKTSIDSSRLDVPALP